MATAKKSVTTPPTRCDQGGQEVIVGVVPVEPGALVKLHLMLCRAAFRVTIFLDGELKLDQSPVVDELEFLLPLLSPGFHNLHWAYLAAGASWQTRSELSVNGAVRFRQRKSSESNIPINQTFITLQVLP
jgi:hypothetical protein